MAWQASDFDATASAVKVKSEKMFKDVFHGTRKLDQVVKPILETQKVDFREVKSGGRCKGIEVYRLGNFNEDYAANNHVESCNITGGITSVKAQSFLNNVNLSVNGFVKDDDCPTLYSAIDKYMYIKKEAMSNLITSLSWSIISKLSLNAQKNNHTTFVSDYYPGDGAIVGGNVVLYVDFTDKTVGHMYESAVMNAIEDPLLITGKNLYQSMLMSKFSSDGCCNMSGVYESDLFDYVFARLMLQNDTYVVDKSAIFFHSTNKYDNTIPKMLDGNTKAWKEKLVGLQYRNAGKMTDIYLDVKSQRKCVEGEWGTAYQFILGGGLHCPINNVPTDTDDQPLYSGILKFSRKARP